MKVFYSPKQVVDQGEQNLAGIIKSPSAMKPKYIAEAIKDFTYIELVEPNPVIIDDLKLCHEASYVDNVMNLVVENGFGCKSKEVNASLLYTNGAMLDAARAATANSPSCALVSGFHHAGYHGWKGLGYFCTFNGLIITAMKLLQEHMSKITIIDCDMHWGNGTDNILSCKPELYRQIKHITFGKVFHSSNDADEYLNELTVDENGCVYSELAEYKPDVILYQAGADVHVNDPYGGIFNTEQIYERDLRIFRIAKSLNIPIAWNLAGGYQIEEDGSIDKVIEIHLNTFKACQEVYGLVE